MDTFTQVLLATAEMQETASGILDSIASFLPFPWNYIVSAVGGAVITLFFTLKGKKKAESVPAEKSAE